MTSYFHRSTQLCFAIIMKDSRTSGVQSIDGTIDYEEFKRIFNKNKIVLQDFVLENYDLDTIEDWTQKKAAKLKKKAKKTRGKHKFDNWKVLKSI